MNTEDSEFERIEREQFRLVHTPDANYNIAFHNGGTKIGALDFNGPEMVFTGDADESAKVFFDCIAKSFKARLEQERADERNSWPSEMEAMERQVNILTDALAKARSKT